MLAINHVTLATATVFAASLYLNQPFFLPFMIFVVFASLLPDIDHPNSEVSNFLPVIHHALPHRGVTHSILGVAVFGFGLQFLLGYSTVLTAVLIVASLIGVFYLEELISKRAKQFTKLSHGLLSQKQVKFMLKFTTGILAIFLISLLFLIWKERFREEIIWLLAAGFAAHLIGDLITKDGIPLFWPLRQRFALKVFRTGHWLESLIGVFLIGLNFYLGYEFWIRYGLSNFGYWEGYLR
ncbi:MAG: hypothetical protein OHK0017_12350 [Patescibacteria group bacterium]